MGDQASNVIPAIGHRNHGHAAGERHGPSKTAERLIEHIRKQGFFVVDQEPGAEVRMVAYEGGPGREQWRTEARQRLSMDLPISQEVIRVVESARGPAVKVAKHGRRYCRRISVSAPLGSRHRASPSGITTTTSTAITRICGYRICGTALS